MQINPHPTIEQSRFRGTAIMLMAALLVTATSANTKALGQSLTTSARPIINIQFNDGGTVGEYLGSLHEQCESQKFKLNVIVDEGTKAVKLPSFTLRDVSLDSAMGGLGRACVVFRQRVLSAIFCQNIHASIRTYKYV